MQNNSQILIYQAYDGQTKIEVKLQDETVWLTQKQMSELFQTDRSSITKHIRNVIQSGELDEKSVCAIFAQTAKDGKTYKTQYYNLDMIISVGYRINSIRGTQFRIWATKRLKEYIIKGFVMDDERLAEGGTVNGINYFNELLERVRKIRASEKNLYEKVRDIFATSIDYNSNTKEAREFFAAVQNKFHYAITGYTASELIIERINSKKGNMGLTNWKGTDLTKKDAVIAKNYMIEKELKLLYLLVEQFLSFAELQISLERAMYMADWKSYLNDFLKLNRLEILKSRGSVSHKKMEAVVKKELQKFLTKKITAENE